MEPGPDTGPPLVLGRYLAVDEQGTGLRATWRPAHGFVNLSLWRGDECVETFHLTAHQVGEFVSFLAGALAEAVPEPSRGPLRVVPLHETQDPPSPAPTSVELLIRSVSRVRRRLSRTVANVRKNWRPQSK